MTLATHAIALTAALAFIPAAPIGGPPDRQYYEDWYQPKDADYYVSRYFFKEFPDDEEYKYHYVIWYPKKPKHYYYFNPDTGLFWCRALVSSRDAEDIWQVLAKFDPEKGPEDNEQKSVVTEIPEAVWKSKQLSRPKIPGREQKAPMAVPPRPPSAANPTH